MTTRNDVKQLVKNIENLAKEMQSKLDGTSDLLTVANELVRNSLTFVFALGELSVLEQPSVSKGKSMTVVKAASKPNYHNKRDKSGRFVSVS
jgi:hypothetical protein